MVWIESQRTKEVIFLNSCVARTCPTNPLPDLGDNNLQHYLKGWLAHCCE